MIYSKQELIVGFSIMVIFILLVFFLRKPAHELQCDAKYEFAMSSIDGIVIDKFIDKKEHNYLTIIYRADSGNRRLIMDRYPKFFEILKVGDTIYKPKESLRVKIDSDRYYTVDFDVDCK